MKSRVILAAITAVVLGCLPFGGYSVVRAAQGQEDSEYMGAIRQYVHGYPVDAVAIVKRFDQERLKKSASRMVARRGDVGRIDVLGAGLLHLEIALSERNIPGRYGFGLNLALARELLHAADGMAGVTRASSDATELRALHVVALFLLDDVSGRDARTYLKDWLFDFPHAPTLLIAMGSACESQGTGRWDAITDYGLPTVEATEYQYLNDALRYFDAALARQPGSAEALLHKAVVLNVLHDRTASERAARAVLTMDPAPEWRYLALLTLGGLRANAADRDGAMHAVGDALRLFPNAQSGTLALAALQDANNQPEVAGDTVQRLMQGSSTAGVTDPWWDYRFGHAKKAMVILNALRAEMQK